MARFGTYKNDPRQITAKFNSKCAETGKEIKKGENCIYYPSSKEVFCMESKQAREFEQMSFDNDYLGGNY